MLLNGAISSVTVSTTSTPPSTQRAISKLLTATDALFLIVTLTLSVAVRFLPLTKFEAVTATSLLMGKVSNTSII